MPPAPVPVPSPAPAVERAPADAPASVPSAEEGVLAALDRYRSAFRARNINQLLEVYPGLSRGQADQLRKNFPMLAQYQVEVRNPAVQVQGDVATVQARVDLRIRPRVGGQTQSFQQQTEFRLRRSGSVWLITDAIIR